MSNLKSNRALEAKSQPGSTARSSPGPSPRALVVTYPVTTVPKFKLVTAAAVSPGPLRGFARQSSSSGRLRQTTDRSARSSARRCMSAQGGRGHWRPPLRGTSVGVAHFPQAQCRKGGKIASVCRGGPHRVAQVDPWQRCNGAFNSLAGRHAALFLKRRPGRC
jgi:hypothetical protein